VGTVRSRREACSVWHSSSPPSVWRSSASLPSWVAAARNSPAPDRDVGAGVARPGDPLRGRQQPAAAADKRGRPGPVQRPAARRLQPPHRPTPRVLRHDAATAPRGRAGIRVLHPSQWSDHGQRADRRWGAGRPDRHVRGGGRLRCVHSGAGNDGEHGEPEKRAVPLHLRRLTDSAKPSSTSHFAAGVALPPLDVLPGVRHEALGRPRAGGRRLRDVREAAVASPPHAAAHEAKGLCVPAVRCVRCPDGDGPPTAVLPGLLDLDRQAPSRSGRTSSDVAEHGPHASPA
jgi:hypothetical protein